MKRQIDILDKSGLVKFDPRQLKKFIKTLDDQMPPEFRAPEGDLSIAVFNDADLAKIHGDFLNKPTPTDVITFEGDPDDGLAGEICVSAERARACAASFGTTPSEELCLYIAHGTLHLAGVNDIEEEDAKIMRRGESLALNVLAKNFEKPIFLFDV